MILLLGVERGEPVASRPALSAVLKDRFLGCIGSPVVQKGLLEPKPPQGRRPHLGRASLVLSDAVAQRPHVMEQEVGVGEKLDVVQSMGWTRP